MPLSKAFLISFLSHVAMISLTMSFYFTYGIKNPHPIISSYLYAERTMQTTKIHASSGFPSPSSQKNTSSKKIASLEKHIDLTDAKKQEKEILTLLHDAIANAQIYPDEAHVLNQEGVVKIGFILHPDGRLSNIEVLQSSGFQTIDNAALSTLNHLSPLTFASLYLKKETYFSIAMIFKLS